MVRKIILAFGIAALSLSAAREHHLTVTRVDDLADRAADQVRRIVELELARVRPVYEHELLPPHGVYATTAQIGDVMHASVTNIGVRPTVDDSGRATVETHIFNFDRDLYGAAIRLGFVQRLRDERAFESLAQLQAQIAADCARARVLFDRLSL